MATIDYKEKYEQALERARQFSEKPYLEDSAGIVEYIFPELKESDDERIRKELIFYFQEEIPQCSIQEHADKMKEFIAWLEKQEHKPAWSEEDERKIGDIRDAITLDDELEESYKEELYDFLKSLRPQSHWKPSDEQMSTLEYYMYTLICNRRKEILFGLYADLKKLREE